MAAHYAVVTQLVVVIALKTTVDTFLGAPQTWQLLLLTDGA
jgi:hypothetical protein